MCGILGVFSRGGKLDDRLHRCFEIGLGLMYGRGPDGFWVFGNEEVLLGQTALLITDPGGGLHPYVSQDGRHVACANGEIYNADELRRLLQAEGVRFRSDSDCEVLGHGFRRFSFDLLPRLDGMFGLAVYDCEEQSLTLARDRVGIRPLYYTQQPGYVAFASEPRILTASGLASSEPSDEGVMHALILRRALDPVTVYRDVYSVLPGQMLRFHHDGSSSQRIFAAIPTQSSQGAPDGAAAPYDPDALGEIIRWSVERRIPARCKYSLFLSGGLDSTIVNALTPADPQHRLPSLVCGFSFPGMVDERHMARQAAQALSIQLIEQTVSVEQFLSIWPFIVWAHGEPLMFNSAIPLFLLCRTASQLGAKVILSGEGADEMFAGYAQYPAYAQTPDDGTPEYLLRHDAEINDPRHVIDTWLADPRFGESGWQTLRSRIAQALPARGPGHGLARKLEFDRMTFMRGLLMRQDCVGLSTGIEVRVPFLDGRVVQAATAHAAQGHLYAGQGKHLLRRTFAPLLSEKLASVPKIGFPVPVASWLDQPAFFRATRLLGQRLDDWPLFRKHAIADAVARAHTTPREGYKHLWTLLNLSLWWSTRDQPPPPHGPWAELMPDGTADQVAALLTSTQRSLPQGSLQSLLTRQGQPAVLLSPGWGAIHARPLAAAQALDGFRINPDSAPTSA